MWGNFSGYSKRLFCVVCPECFFEWSQLEAGMYDRYVPSVLEWSQLEAGMYDLYVPSVFQ